MSFFRRSFSVSSIADLKSKGDIKALAKALRYSDENNVRAAAASALGAFKSTRTVEPLIAALEDYDPVVRFCAREALERIGDSAVEPLIAALKDGNESVRKEAAAALDKIGGPQSVLPLIAALKDTDTDVR